MPTRKVLRSYRINVKKPFGLLGATLTKLPEQRLREIERGHHVNLASCGDDSLEGRHRAGNCALAQKRHQADHCEAAVVDLSLQLLGLPLVTLVLVEVEGIVQVERDGMRQKRATLCVRENAIHGALEWREEARLAAPHVVSAHARAQCLGSLRVELKDANGQNDLQLGFVGDALPERRRADAGRAELVAGDLPRKVDAVRVDAVAHEAGHRDAAVLDLPWRRK